MKLIEDLGVRQAGEQGYRKSYGLYECPVCHEHFECATTKIVCMVTKSCFSCGVKKRALLQTSNAAKLFIKKAEAVHGKRYNYTLVEYVNNKTKIRIVCAEHGDFLQEPRDHLKGRGCPCCAMTGFNKSKSATLYYLRVDKSYSEVYYKIGITNRTVESRFTKKDLELITVLKQWEFPIGSEAYRIEQEILKENAEYKYVGCPILSSGNTELFTEDILSLDIVKG